MGIQRYIYEEIKNLKVQLFEKNEKLKASIVELAERIKYDRDIPKLQAQGSKNIIVIYMKQSLRKKMESGFNHWYWITKRVITKKFLDRKMMLLRQEKQNNMNNIQRGIQYWKQCLQKCKLYTLILVVVCAAAMYFLFRSLLDIYAGRSNNAVLPIILSII